MMAALDTWKAVQTFYQSLPELNPNITSKTFHLATQSYGGHWGPVFFNSFRKQNQLKTRGRSAHQVTLDIGTLLIVNGLINYKTQAPAYPRFARNNTHGVELNETIVNYMETALHLEVHGCLDFIESCEAAEMMFNDTSIADNMACNTASALCRNAVELVYVQKSPEQDPYDIRNHALHPQAPSVFPLWLNTGEVQKAIGIDLNYTLPANREVLASFWFSSDLVRSGALADLNELLNTGIRVVLMHGDSDYVCNWYEGQDLSLAVNSTGAERFRQAGYTPMVAGGKHHGDTREAGSFSFTRIFDAGHAAPCYRPEASLASPCRH
jgi:carboxypeptidase C (cathepsin A)